MPDTPLPQASIKTEAVDWSDIGYQLATGAVKLAIEGKGGDHFKSLLVEAEHAGGALALDLAETGALKVGTLLHGLEELLLPVLAAFIAPVVSGLFGAEVNEATFKRKLTSGEGAAPARAIVEGLMRAIAGDAGGELQPSTEGSKRIASAAVQAALESEFNAIATEMISDLIPEIGPHFTALTELPENIIRALGVGRLVRRALGPLIDATCTTPARWHVNKTYRPELLSPGDVVRQVMRGKWTRDQANEELARLGYAPRRIEALFNAAQKFFGPGDVRTFLSREEWSHDKALRHLQDQGYDEQGATDALRLEGLRRFEQLEGQEASALIGAYAARDIDRSTFARMLGECVRPASERALYTELAEVRRAVNVKYLSAPQVAAMVRSGVANVRDYRDAAEREGYDDQAVTLLELQLRYELDKEKAIEQHRRELEAARAAEKVARDAALEARRAEIDAERAIRRRGAEADLERAVVRGLIPMARLEEVYAVHYDADTIEILAGLVENARLEYLATHAARDEALKRGARRNLDVGAIEAAFYQNLVTAAELEQRLRSMGFDASDAALLAATAAARKADLDAALKKRKEADARAAERKIDLGRFEQLVRRGARSIAQYDALLESLGFDQASRAAMIDLLQLHIQEDAAARAERERVAAENAQRGLSLEEIRRAVILGIRTEDAFSRYMVDEGFTADAQQVLLAELRVAVDEANAARQRRSTTDPTVERRELALSTVRKAAQLGIVTVDAYQARLEEAGYSPDDIEIELELLVTEIADAQAARDAATAVLAPVPAKALSLADVERAVKSGVVPIEAYRAKALELGFSLGDADVLTAVVAAELSTLNAARRRRDELAFQLATAGYSVAELEAQVTSGALDVGGYVAQLEAWDVQSADAELLAALLVFTLTNTKPPA